MMNIPPSPPPAGNDVPAHIHGMIIFILLLIVDLLYFYYMRIYLDTNVWCRPFDDLEQNKIRKEAESFEKIKTYAGEKIFKIFISDILIAELLLIEDDSKRDLVLREIREITDLIVPADKNVYKYGDILYQKLKINNIFDCYHLSSAIIGKAEYFLTCDQEIIRKSGIISSISENYKNIIIINPINFIKELKL